MKNGGFDATFFLSAVLRTGQCAALLREKGINLTTVHTKGGAKASIPARKERGQDAVARALELVLTSLEDSKAEDIVSIDIAGKSALGDHMVVASGRSTRHVAAICDHLISDLKEEGFGNARVEGLDAGDWVLIDTGDIIVHVFRPEIREFYNIERMWSAPELDGETVH